jgi:hypothetical protein
MESEPLAGGDLGVAAGATHSAAGAAGRPDRARLLSPVGLLLVLVLFLLPFVTVSCSTPAGDVTATYQGVDLVLDSKPAVELPDELREEAGITETDAAPPADAQLPALISVFLILGAIGLGFLPERRLRLLGVAGAATLAAAMLFVTELVAVSHLRDGVREISGPEDMFGATPNTEINNIVRLGWGFWVALILLVAVAGYHSVAAVRAERAARTEEEEGYGTSLPLFDHRPE